MYIAKVYEIMIGAPSDIQEEIQMAENTIYRWNNINSETHRLVLLPLHWSKNAYPEVGVHPQKAINKQVVNKSDLLICIFGTRLGTPTDTEESGIIEEINEHIKEGKQVLIFFRNINDTKSIDINQYQKVINYKRSIQDKSLYAEYNDESDFEQVLSDKLQLFINNEWLNQKEEKEEEPIVDENVKLELSKKAIDVLCGSFVYIDVLGDVDVNKCSIDMDDNNLAFAEKENSKIKVKGKKVGETKITVTYKTLKVECSINITPMCYFCGNPILEFGKDFQYIKEKCYNMIYYNVDEITCKDDNIRCKEIIENYTITHYYIFEDNKLIFAFSFIPKNSQKYNIYIESSNCMYERYDSISSNNNVQWYQYKSDYYIGSADWVSKGGWFFFYSRSKEMIDEKLRLWVKQ